MSYRTFVLAVAVAASASPAAAQDFSAQDSSLPPTFAGGDIVRSNNQFSLDFLGTDFGYSETGDGRFGTQTGLLDTEKGWTPGLSVSTSIMRDVMVSNLYLAGDFSWLNGRTTYTGSYFGGGGYGSYVGTDGETMRDFDFKIGKGFGVASNCMLTPYVGAGLNEWDRRVNDGEYYRNDYVGAGLLYQFAPFGGFVLSLDGLVGTTFSSRFSAAGPASISGPLGNSPIYKVGLSGDYALTQSVHVNAGVDYTEFHYGATATYDVADYLVWEPPSATSDLRAKVGLGIAF